MLNTGDHATVIRSHFDDLRRLKEFREKRDLSIRTISEETGLSQGAILRVKNLSLQRVYFSTLETLCEYFEVKSLADLIEYVPDGADAGPLIAGKKV
jgi:Predicted transcriptional regulator